MLDVTLSLTLTLSLSLTLTLTPILTRYDHELLMLDENNKIQLLLYGVLAQNEADCLPGHIWVPRDEFELMSMRAC